MSATAPIQTRFIELWLAGTDAELLGRMAKAMQCSEEEVLLKLIRRLEPDYAERRFKVSVCASCGLPFFRRNAVPGQDVYCSQPECKAEANRVRQARYRERHKDQR